MKTLGFCLLAAIAAAITASGQYVRGPRGGCYTIIKSGTKRYVDRSLCEDQSPSTSRSNIVASTTAESAAKKLYHRLNDDQGRCFELYRDWTWAMVDSSRCLTPESSKPSAVGNAVPSASTSAAAAPNPLGSSGSKYLTGSKGGCYTLTSNGRKKYVPRSYCQ